MIRINRHSTLGTAAPAAPAGTSDLVKTTRAPVAGVSGAAASTAEQPASRQSWPLLAGLRCAFAAWWRRHICADRSNDPPECRCHVCREESFFHKERA